MSDTDTSPRCRSCGTYLAPSAIICPVCKAQTQLAASPTERSEEALTVDPDIPPPDPLAMPAAMPWINLGLLAAVLLFGVVLRFAPLGVDRQQIFSQWAAQGAQALASGNQSPYWVQIATSSWPPRDAVQVVYSSNRIDADHRFLDDLLTQIDLPAGPEPILVAADRLEQVMQGLETSNPRARRLKIVRADSPLFLQLAIDYAAPELQGTPIFRWEMSSGPIELYGVQLALLVLAVAGAAGLRSAVIGHHRQQQRQEYEHYQSRRTEQRFATQERLQTAYALAGAGEVAKALAAVNEVLRVLPRSRDALELKQALLRSQHAGAPSLSLQPAAGGKISRSATVLYLRVLGTPYAYQAPPDLASIAIGRQRRRPDADADTGNDVVMRVPGSEELSLRISRRHLEIRRIDEEYFVIDRSSGQTRLDGAVLPADRPVRITTGSRLQIAGVLTLEVLIRTHGLGHKINNVLQVNTPNSPSDSLLIEATIGNMLTEIRDE